MAVILIPAISGTRYFLPTKIYALQSSWVAIFLKHTFSGAVLSVRWPSNWVMIEAAAGDHFDVRPFDLTFLG